MLEDFANLLPRSHLLGLALGNNGDSIVVFQRLNEDFKNFTDVRRNHSLFVQELGRRDEAVGFEADVNGDPLLGGVRYRALDDVLFFDA